MNNKSILPWHRSTEAYHPLAAFDDILKSLFDEPLSALSRVAGEDSFNPRFNFEEKDEAYLVTAEVPGMTEADLDISIDNECLTVSGHKKEDYNREEKGARYVGRSYGSFSRVIPLKSEVNREAVDASLEKGVLKIFLPKCQETEKKAKKVEIRS